MKLFPSPYLVIKPSKIRFLILLVGLIIVVLFSSNKNIDTEIHLNIHYTLNYPEDSWQKNRTGLIWTLSYLGAELPKNSFDSSIVWKDKQTFSLNFNSLGFNNNALQALRKITDSLKTTAVYKKKQAIDLGHFIAITLGSSWHYYSITNAPSTLSDYLASKHIKHIECFPLPLSGISSHHRILKINANDTITNTFLMAEEGEGDVKIGTFITKEVEVIDIMKNGQLRVIIYDVEGNIVATASKLYSNAGKPAKCIWCHEIAIPGLLTKPDSVVGFIGPEEFVEKIRIQNLRLTNYRKTLNSDLDFTKTQDHTYQEIIYTSYMEPSLKRLSQEWNISEKKLQRILNNKTKHTHHEFRFLGELMDRNDVLYKNSLLPGKLPGNIREESNCEPNYLRTYPRN
jgi:hypothetical protein